MWETKKKDDFVSLISTNLRQEEKKPAITVPSDFFSTSTKQLKKKNKHEWWKAFGPGGGVGIGCGVGVGLAITGGFGLSLSPFSEISVIQGIGAGCGVGIGYGYGFGWGYRWDQTYLPRERWS